MRRKKLDIYINKAPKKIIFCTKCVMSNQRPRITLDENNICSACNYLSYKNHEINWEKKEKELIKLANKIRKKNGEWDVLVPGSGGKDSSFVAHTLKTKYHLNPLCVTWAPFKYTNIGFQNFSEFTNSGFLTINCFGNGQINRLLARLCFEEIGDNFTPFTFGQHGFVYHIANKFKINHIFFGEAADAEYGGNAAKHKNNPGHSISDNEKLYWKGNNVRKLVKFGIKNKKYFARFNQNHPDLNFYEPPKKINPEIKMYHMSYFHYWRPQENYYYASENTGFKPSPERSKGTYSKYASLDDKLDILHYYLMFIKFGIGRATSDAAHEIREELISREEGVNLVEKYDSEFDIKDYEETIDYLSISKDHFFKVIDSFRQDHVWGKLRGQWKLKHTVGKNGIDD